MPELNRSLSEGMRRLQKVVYSEERVAVALGNNKPFPQDLFFRKSSDWAYEDEWRVLARFSDMPEYSFRKQGEFRGLDIITLPLDLRFVTEIIVGARADKAVEQAALKFAREAENPVHVYRMCLSEHLFKMEKEGPLACD